jgi:hypothetical protein
VDFCCFTVTVAPSSGIPAASRSWSFNTDCALAVKAIHTEAKTMQILLMIFPDLNLPGMLLPVASNGARWLPSLRRYYPDQVQRVLSQSQVSGPETPRAIVRTKLGFWGNGEIFFSIL